MHVKSYCALKSLLAISLLSLAVNASAIEYSAPGDPSKIRVFEADTNLLVSHSFRNFCDLPAGEYIVKIFYTPSNPADETVSLVLEGDGDTGEATDTLANLNCADGEVAKFISGVWSCAEDLVTDPNVFDTVAALEGLFCISGEILMRDPDTSAIRCVPEFECPASALSLIDQTNDRYVEQSSLSDLPGECVALYTNELVNTDVFETRLSATANAEGDGGAFVRRISSPVSVSTSTRGVGDIGDLRACALLVGCTNF